MSMSQADEFRQSTKDFWLKMDQKGKVPKATAPSLSKKPSARRALPKSKKRKL